DLCERGFRVTPFDFFFALPQHSLYRPVRACPRDVWDRDFEREYCGRRDATPVFDLTALLEMLIAKGDRRSVLLETRGGAGKTVASRAALYDCLFFHPVERQAPRLDGLLPCVLRRIAKAGTIQEVLERKRKATVTSSLILDLLARAAFKDHRPASSR